MEHHGPIRLLMLAPILGLAACSDPVPPPPAPFAFEGVPVAGSRVSAGAAGFGSCLVLTRGALRCRKSDVSLLGVGPYQAAIDLKQEDGSGGFDHITLWHDGDQSAILAIGDALKKAGWHNCLKGEQEDYTQPGSPVRIAIDVSYWGKRRAVIAQETGEARPRC